MRNDTVVVIVEISRVGVGRGFLEEIMEILDPIELYHTVIIMILKSKKRGHKK